MSDCPLCRAEKLSEWFFEDEVCYVCICVTCHLPMIVLRHHGKPSEQELEHLKCISKKVFPEKQWRGYARSIPMEQHFHQHFIEKLS